MKKFLSVLLLVTLAVFLASWSFSGQTTISRAPMAQAAKAKAASQNNEAAKQAELAKANAEQPAPAVKADVVNNDEISKPKETEAPEAKAAVEQPPKWQPVYGEKGEILNPQPSVNLLDAGGKQSFTGYCHGIPRKLQ
jgi:predicted lipid-binding transport protein (Tim44 family)